MDASPDTMDRRIARRLRALRLERDWSLDGLARESGVSRATLSRLENGEVSPTTAVLGKLCAAFSLTLSRLMHMVEDGFAPLVRQADQAVWTDAEAGFRRRLISPPAASLAGEAIECALDPGAHLTYERPPREGLEHHLYLLAGRLAVTVGGATHELEPGDCLRYQLTGPSAFRTEEGARYVVFFA